MLVENKYFTFLLLFAAGLPSAEQLPVEQHAQRQPDHARGLDAVHATHHEQHRRRAHEEVRISQGLRSTEEVSCIARRILLPRRNTLLL